MTRLEFPRFNGILREFSIQTRWKWVMCAEINKNKMVFLIVAVVIVVGFVPSSPFSACLKQSVNIVHIL